MIEEEFFFLRCSTHNYYGFLERARERESWRRGRKITNYEIVREVIQVYVTLAQYVPDHQHPRTREREREENYYRNNNKLTRKKGVVMTTVSKFSWSFFEFLEKYCSLLFSRRSTPECLD